MRGTEEGVARQAAAEVSTQVKRAAPQRAALPRRDEIEVSGPVSTDTLWEADKVKVIGDVIVENGVTLTIAPGVIVEFQDYYGIAIQGRLLAVGTPASRIVFTTDDPGSFAINAEHTGCWSGLRFHDTPETNGMSRLECCILEYSKATFSSRDAYPYGGGAISLYNFSKLVVSRCILRNNVAANGGALFLYRNANALIEGNLIVDNHALENAAAIYCSYSFPEIVNNTVANNTIHNAENPYIDSTALLTFLAKPKLLNNIFYRNDPEIVYMHSQLFENKEYYTLYNNIEAYEGGGLNLDGDPGFIAEPGLFADYRLRHSSPCINRASNTGSPAVDLEGNARPHMGTMDMGAYEYVDTHTLAADRFTFSEAGDSVSFTLDAHPENGNRNYLLVGGVSGTLPGYTLPGGQAILPVNFDLFTTLVLFPLLNTVVFQDFMGTLLPDGTSEATLFCGPLPPGYVGLKMQFAFCLGWTWEFVSNPVEIVITPS
ncbi:MAG: right-handed parallel beta-helix repeat-containing protein [Planctomycetota bacterium]